MVTGATASWIITNRSRPFCFCLFRDLIPRWVIYILASLSWILQHYFLSLIFASLFFFFFSLFLCVCVKVSYIYWDFSYVRWTVGLLKMLTLTHFILYSLNVTNFLCFIEKAYISLINWNIYFFTMRFISWTPPSIYSINQLVD